MWARTLLYDGPQISTRGIRLLSISNRAGGPGDSKAWAEHNDPERGGYRAWTTVIPFAGLAAARPRARHAARSLARDRPVRRRRPAATSQRDQRPRPGPARGHSCRRPGRACSRPTVDPPCAGTSTASALATASTPRGGSPRLAQPVRPRHQRVRPLVGCPVQVPDGPKDRKQYVAAALPQGVHQPAGVRLGAHRVVDGDRPGHLELGPGQQRVVLIDRPASVRCPGEEPGLAAEQPRSQGRPSPVLYPARPSPVPSPRRPDTHVARTWRPGTPSEVR